MLLCVCVWQFFRICMCPGCSLASVGFSFGVYNTYRWWCCLQVEGERTDTNINKHAKRKLDDDDKRWPPHDLAVSQSTRAGLSLPENFREFYGASHCANSSNFATPHLADDEVANFGKASREAPWKLCDCNIILSIHLYLADSFDRKPSSDCLFGFFVESSRDFE